MKHLRIPFFSILLLLVAVSALGDTLVLRNGKSIQGTFLGANTRQIDFQTQDGKTQQFAITDIDRIVFSTPAAAAPVKSAAPAPARIAALTLLPPAPIVAARLRGGWLESNHGCSFGGGGSHRRAQRASDDASPSAPARNTG